MLSLLIPDVEQVKRWLTQAGIQHYICDQCHGLHLSELQVREGVSDARLFVEEDRLLLTTELELRPSALVMALVETSALNMQYPLLKVFSDVGDDVLPRLVACNLLLTRQGVTFEQFIHFMQATVDETVSLIDQCMQSGWLVWPDEGEDADIDLGSSHPPALH